MAEKRSAAAAASHYEKLVGEPAAKRSRQESSEKVAVQSSDSKIPRRDVDKGSFASTPSAPSSASSSAITPVASRPTQLAQQQQQVGIRCPKHGHQNIVLQRCRKQNHENGRLFWACKGEKGTGCEFMVEADTFFPACLCRPAKRAVLRISKKKEFLNRWFFGCPGSPGGAASNPSTRCGFFAWAPPQAIMYYGPYLTPLT
eukprot:TRINITY_DN74503_c0_g1_i1.p1 TRINITY_DN74503_c0_g1~~TRINITY_DN74503_c0_g1_i1.p1  ORF type:complete len:201 (+),score=35.16 TRINITY_DN74503_c0_g1_i1:101-703(+)